MEPANDRARTLGIVSEWYALNPAVRRLWIYEPAGAQALQVLVVLAPVADSDEVTPIWLAKAAGWQRELEGLVGRPVQLDAMADSEPAQTFGTSIAWRS